MKFLRLRRTKQRGRVAGALHWLLVASLPVLIYTLVLLDFVAFVFAIILLSKWRMFAVRPRYWPANIRANAVDLIIGLSVLVFMTNTSSMSWQLVWTIFYSVWLIVIKPGSSIFKVTLQAGLGQVFGLMALFMGLGGASSFVLVLGVWAICYLSARHFFSAFDETRSSLLAHLWGYFAAALAWVLTHWLLFYGVVSQVTLLLSVIGFSLATLYYLDHTDRLSVLLRRQFVFLMVAIVIVVLVFSDWGDKTI